MAYIVYLDGVALTKKKRNRRIFVKGLFNCNDTEVTKKVSY